ncbi:hypothetical protein GCM10029964_085640 [Kibdelosporangium lantanae]
MFADRAYDHDKHRRQAQAAGITPIIARRGTAHGSGLGKYRWVVEQTFALLHWFRRLRILREIRHDIHEAFLHLGVRHHLLPPTGQPATLSGVPRRATARSVSHDKQSGVTCSQGASPASSAKLRWRYVPTVSIS